MEGQPDTSRQIVLIDFDQFYAQCKEVANPALQNVPLAITQKHIVVTSNTEARKRGVQKLQSIDDAKRACPEICLQSGEDLTPFRNASKANEKVARRFGVTQRSGLDELFIDVTEEVSRRLAHPTSRETERAIQWRGHRATPNVIASNHRRPMDIAAASECQPSPDEEDHQGGNVAINRLKLATHVAEDIRSSLKAETGFRASAGIANNKLLAKLCSGLHKPNDQTFVLPKDAQQFVAALPVRALPGCGGKLERALVDKGIHKAEDLRRYERLQLVDLFGRSGEHLFEACRGQDSSPVVDSGPPRTVSEEDSFKYCDDFAAVEQVVRRLAPVLVSRLREDESEHERRYAIIPRHLRRARTLSIKWREEADSLKGKGRSSTSSALPVDVYTAKQKNAAVEALVEASMRLVRKYLRQYSKFRLKALNMAATNFTEPHDRKLASLEGFITRSVNGEGDQGAHDECNRETGKRKREGTSVVGHLDIDNFFVSCERLDEPGLEGMPVAVHQFHGGGFIALSNEAKAKGLQKGDAIGSKGRRCLDIQSAAPSKAKQLCPDLVCRPMRPERYRAISKSVKMLLKEFFAKVERSSYDDFYVLADEDSQGNGIDPAPKGHLPDGAVTEPNDCEGRVTMGEVRAASKLVQAREALRSRIGLPASVSVASGKTFARLVSQRAKSATVAVVPFGAEGTLAKRTAITALPGLMGKLGQELCRRYALETVGDLETLSRADIASCIGKKLTEFVMHLLRGEDGDSTIDDRPPQAVTAEISFQPISSNQLLRKEIEPLSSTLFQRVVEDYGEHQRLPVKLTVHWRHGYRGDVKSRSVDIPHECLASIRREDEGSFVSSATDKALSIIGANASEPLDVSRCILAARYEGNSGRAGNQSTIRSFFKGQEEEEEEEEEGGEVRHGGHDDEKGEKHPNPVIADWPTDDNLKAALRSDEVDVDFLFGWCPGCQRVTTGDKFRVCTSCSPPQSL